MSEALNVTKAAFGGLREVTTAPLWQWDYGQILQIKGLDLPQAFEVHFSNSRKSGETITQIGSDSQVVIPDMYLTSGADIYCFIFLHDGLTDGETEYVIKIPVKERPEPSDIEPTPEQQDVITQAIAALNTAVTQTGEDKAATAALAEAAAASSLIATQAAQSAQGSATSASGSATTASTAAATATTKASEAATSAASAASAKTAAETAEANAQAAQTAAETAAASIAPVDPTLSITGRAADAKATGDRLDSLTETVGGKQDTLTFDDAPTSGSANPVKSSGVYVAVDTKISKPLTNPMGTNGQLLRTLGNGQTEWTDHGLPTDEQTAQAVSDWLDDHPEATTTVEDGAVTWAKLNSAVQTEIGDKAPAIILNTSKGYAHDPLENLKSVEFYGNNLAIGNAEYSTKKSVLPTLNGWTQTILGVSVTRTGRLFFVFNGVATSGGNSYMFFGHTYDTPLPAGTYRLIVKMNKPITGNSSRFIVRSRDENNRDVDLFNKWKSNSFDETFVAEQPIHTLYIMPGIVNGFEYENLVMWIGIFDSSADIVDTNIAVPSDSSITYSDATLRGLTAIDTMQHESIVGFVSDTKEYVDTHIPDIKKYWTEEIYALPEKFGAIGDGVTDDTQSLIDCIEYASANNKAVRGYGTYKTSASIIFATRGLDVYIRNLNYSGNDNAIIINEQEIRFVFDKIQSSGGGIYFTRAGNRSCARNNISGILLSSVNDCILIGGQTLYTSVSIRQLSSANGNCITYTLEEFASFGGGEYVFRDCSCSCPNGWVLYCPTDSKFYNFTVEGDCLNGIYYPSGCMCYGWRHVEFISRYSERIADPTSEFQHGALIKLRNPINTPNSSNGIVYESENFVFPWSIDSDNIDKNPQFVSGDTDKWWAYANNKTCIKCLVLVPYSVFSSKSTSFIAKEMRVVGGNKVFVPLFESVVNISDAIYDLRFYDTCDIETIRNAAKIFFATKFNILSNTTIYLSASYCATAINKVKINTNGNSVIVYDWRGNKIFDSADYQQTVFNLSCMADYLNRGLAPIISDNRYWTYDGTNHIWEIEGIG